MVCLLAAVKRGETWTKWTYKQYQNDVFTAAKALIKVTCVADHIALDSTTINRCCGFSNLHSRYCIDFAMTYGYLWDKIRRYLYPEKQFVVSRDSLTPI